MPRFVVSANYVDRSNKNARWMVRREDQTEQQAETVPCLVATNVQFKEAGELENGYGCSVVAVCDSVEYPSVAPHLPYDVRFDHVFIACSRALSGCSSLSLSADGSISADGIVVNENDTYNYDEHRYDDDDDYDDYEDDYEDEDEDNDY